MVHKPMTQTASRRQSRTRRLIAFLIANAAFTAIIAAVAFFLGWTTVARALPDPQPWHLEAPDSEFTYEDVTDAYTLDDYIAQEAAVFDELDDLLQNEWSTETTHAISRFNPDSICNPETISDRNWNRSLLLEAEDPVGAALMLHGLSDSPYSFRQLGTRLHENGWTVLFLRLPGHGTCPAALTDVHWRDWTAAVRIAARGLREKLPREAPLALFGFSNGGALSVEYAAASLDDPDLPRPDALILYSPMIGITSLARITELYPVVGRISGLEKVGWSRIEAVIDPFKYSSWPMNAGVQARRGTLHVERMLARLDKQKRMADFPPTLTFQSAVDATVVIPRLLDRFYERLETPGSELVIFDVNRAGVTAGLLKDDYEGDFLSLLERDDAPWAVTLITNESDEAPDLIERRRVSDNVARTPLNMRWPPNIFSLSHGALPIPPSDPILGDGGNAPKGAVSLGALQLRGESGVLRISESLMLRLRYNPFYDYLQQRTLDWLDERLTDRAARKSQAQ